MIHIIIFGVYNGSQIEYEIFLISLKVNACIDSDKRAKHNPFSFSVFHVLFIAKSNDIIIIIIFNFLMIDISSIIFSNDLHLIFN